MSERHKNDPLYDNWEDHRDDIIARFASGVMDKYTRGQEKHGGRLWRKAALPHAYQEVQDLSVYMETLKAQHERLKFLLIDAISKKDWGTVFCAYRLVEFGNEDGVPEEELEP